jgi:hypothetical protein
MTIGSCTKVQNGGSLNLATSLLADAASSRYPALDRPGSLEVCRMRVNRRRLPSQVGCSPSVARRRLAYFSRSTPETPGLDALRSRLTLVFRIDPRDPGSTREIAPDPDEHRSPAAHLVGAVANRRGR